jgi:hypothetical protein
MPVQMTTPPDDPTQNPAPGRPVLRLIDSEAGEGAQALRARNSGARAQARQPVGVRTWRLVTQASRPAPRVPVRGFSDPLPEAGAPAGATAGPPALTSAEQIAAGGGTPLALTDPRWTIALRTHYLLDARTCALSATSRAYVVDLGRTLGLSRVGIERVMSVVIDDARAGRAPLGAQARAQIAQVALPAGPSRAQTWLTRALGAFIFLATMGWLAARGFTMP